MRLGRMMEQILLTPIGIYERERERERERTNNLRFLGSASHQALFSSKE
jgi:hypothetical protein